MTEKTRDIIVCSSLGLSTAALLFALIWEPTPRELKQPEPIVEKHVEWTLDDFTKKLDLNEEEAKDEDIDEVTDEPLEEVDDDDHKYESLFSEEYLTINRAIKRYADKYASFDFHGVTIDGLAVMAQANTESAYMCDPTKTITALYPSIFVDISSTADIENLNAAKVWGNKSALNGTYCDIPFWTEKAGPFYAWSTGGGVYEQGPLQQRTTPAVTAKLEGRPSEIEVLQSAGIVDYVQNTLYGYEAVNMCTGSEYLDYKMGFETTGDRWAIADNCIIWKSAKEDVLNKLWNKYYSTCGYEPNKYEYLAIMAYTHWIPSVILGDLDIDTAKYYGFNYDGAWFDLAHELSTPQAMSIIRKHVKDNINKNRELYYEYGYTKEQSIRLMQLALNAGSTKYMSDSEPWLIFDELASCGIVDCNSVILHPSYGYQHAMKYALQYLYAYELLEVLLLEGY